MMKELDLRKVTDEVERMCIEGNYFIGKDVLDKMSKFLCVKIQEL